MPEIALPLTSLCSRRQAWLWLGSGLAASTLLTACQTPPAEPSKATKAYRQQAAEHLYARNAHRIYKGKLPPMLYAIGVLELQIDARGRIQRLDWRRRPAHAPEVIAEIERSVRAAAPFPAPAQQGPVTYTETWLWDRSGRFQLDTLSEGQLDH